MKLLPKSFKNPEGFTLVELLIVIAIIAILSVIGITIFSNVQKNARDARRRGDIDSIANALEVNKVAGSVTYAALANAQFASGITPIDSGNGSAQYCAGTSTTNTAVGTASAWLNTAACPSAPSGYTAVAGGASPNPPAAATNWTICALMESGSLLAYCKSSSQ